MSFDFTTLATLWLGATLVLLPLGIIAIRFAVVPLVATILRPGSAPRNVSDAARLAKLEESVGHLTLELDRLTRTTSGPPPDSRTADRTDTSVLHPKGVRQWTSHARRPASDLAGS